MNLIQKLILLLGIGAIVLMGIYPPWIVELSTGQHSAARYALITKPASLTTIDAKRLVVQWAMIAIVTGGLLVIFKDSKKGREMKVLS